MFSIKVMLELQSHLERLSENTDSLSEKSHVAALGAFLSVCYGCIFWGFQVSMMDLYGLRAYQNGGLTHESLMWWYHCWGISRGKWLIYVSKILFTDVPYCSSKLSTQH